MTIRKISRRQSLLGATIIAISTAPSKYLYASTIKPKAIEFGIAPTIQNGLESAAPNAISLQGWLGKRVSANAKNRLLNVDIEPIIAGFEQKPGSHPWIGEHIGKWLHAATLAWANNGDPALKRKIDAAASRLMAAQEPNGYLGTYVELKRFGLYPGADWDVWSHKYCLIGLLTYYQYGHNSAALGSARMAADLLIDTFPAKLSIKDAGTHKGMAATSVLEPIVLLYRLTAEQKYLDFAQYIVKSWDEPDGAAIITTLLNTKKVRKTGNANAYEMLSNLVGLSELARVTGDKDYIQACLNAWQDIKESQLFITGSTSRWEYFQPDYDYRCDTSAHLGETCVTTTWIQLNLSLLQLTGEAKFGDELERTLYNHLSAAQHPQGDDWCYFTALEGRKQYDKHITCCHSSGPRGMALAPTAAFLHSNIDGEDTITMNSFETASAEFVINGEPVVIAQNSGFPRNGDAIITLKMNRPTKLKIKIRTPDWAIPLNAANSNFSNGYTIFPTKNYKNNDQLKHTFNIGPRLIKGEHNMAGRNAAAWGPFILAFEETSNQGLESAYRLAFADAPSLIEGSNGNSLRFVGLVREGQNMTPKRAFFKTFADSGADGGSIRVWLREKDSKSQGPFESVLIDGKTSMSRGHLGAAQLNDDDFETFSSTYDGKSNDKDWFAVEIDQPRQISSVVFFHGRAARDGGWFNTSSSKPQVEVKRSRNSEWEPIGVLGNYPKTSAIDYANLNHKWDYRLDLQAPIEVFGVRVIGVPSSGSSATQNHVTCRQLQAFT